MSRDLNQATFTGRLSTDVRKFETHDAKHGAEFTLAIGDEWHDAAGTRQERTDFIGVICYGQLAATALLLQKGDAILATGKMRNEDVPKPTGGIERKTKLRALHLATHREIRPA